MLLNYMVCTQVFIYKLFKIMCVNMCVCVCVYGCVYVCLCNPIWTPMSDDC